MSSATKLLIGAWLTAIIVMGAGGTWVYVGGAPTSPKEETSQVEQGHENEMTSSDQIEDHGDVDDVHSSTDDDKVANAQSESTNPAQEEQTGDTLTPAPSPDLGPNLDTATGSTDTTSTANTGSTANTELFEDGPFGPLPRIADDGRQAWQAFASVDQHIDAPARISIIMSGLGLGRRATEAVITNMPPSITLAFSPYGRDLDNWTERAKNAGFEYLLMVPMEPQRYPENDPGPNTLLKDASTKDNLDNLHQVMGRTTGYIGIMNDMGSAFTANEFAISPILQETKDRGLMFLDARSTNFSLAASLAKQMDVPIAYNNRFLDTPPAEDHIRAMLDALKATAETSGFAVGVARPLPITMRILKKWITEIEADPDIVLVPVSAIVNQQAIR